MTFNIKDISEKKHNGNKIYHLHRSISVTFHKRFPSWMYLQCNSLQKIFSQERNSKVAFHKWYLSILWRNSEVNLKINTLMNTLIGAKKKRKKYEDFFLANRSSKWFTTCWVFVLTDTWKGWRKDFYMGFISSVWRILQNICESKRDSNWKRG